MSSPRRLLARGDSSLCAAATAKVYADFERNRRGNDDFSPGGPSAASRGSADAPVVLEPGRARRLANGVLVEGVEAFFRQRLEDMLRFDVHGPRDQVDALVLFRPV